MLLPSSHPQFRLFSLLILAPMLCVASLPSLALTALAVFSSALCLFLSLLWSSACPLSIAFAPAVSVLVLFFPVVCALSSAVAFSLAMGLLILSDIARRLWSSEWPLAIADIPAMAFSLAWGFCVPSSPAFGVLLLVAFSLAAASMNQFVVAVLPSVDVFVLLSSVVLLCSVSLADGCCLLVFSPAQGVLLLAALPDCSVSACASVFIEVADDGVVVIVAISVALEVAEEGEVVKGGVVVVVVVKAILLVVAALASGAV